MNAIAESFLKQTNPELLVPIDPQDPDAAGKEARRHSQIESILHPSGPRVELVGHEGAKHCIIQQKQ